MMATSMARNAATSARWRHRRSTARRASCGSTVGAVPTTPPRPVAGIAEPPSPEPRRRSPPPYAAATTTVSFMTMKGSNMGRATVATDGVSHTVDLYAAGGAVRTTLNFTVPAANQHTIKVTVLGTKNAASSGTQVRVDGFKIGAQVFDDTSLKIRYGSWSSDVNALALNGSFRVGPPAAVSRLTPSAQCSR